VITRGNVDFRRQAMSGAGGQPPRRGGRASGPVSGSTSPGTNQSPRHRRRLAQPKRVPPSALSQLWQHVVQATSVLGPIQKVVGVVPGIIGAVVWTTHGLQSVLGTNSLSLWLDLHPLGLLLIAFAPIILSVATIGLGLVLTQRAAATTQYQWLFITTSSLSAVGTVLLGGFVATIVLSPSWCPSSLCPQPPGPHDQYLESQLTAIESGAYLIPNDPSTYRLSDLPPSSGASAVAVESTTQSGATATSPYRVVLRVHSLQGGTFGMFIETVDLKILRTETVASPVRVWIRGIPLDYMANPYGAKYAGERSGSDVQATYAGPIPEAHVQLQPGESDELGIALTSAFEADISFQVAIGYRISNATQLRRLLLPYAFRVVFADTANWHRYQLQNGQFAPV